MSSKDAVIEDVHRKIEREKALMQAANAMRQQTTNPQVQSRIETQIRDGRRNIEYLEGRLRELEMRKLGNSMDSMNVGDRPPPPPPHDVPGQPAAYGQQWPRPGEYDSPGDGQQYSQLSGGNVQMPPSAPFARPGPGGAGQPKGRPTYSKLGQSSIVLVFGPPINQTIQILSNTTRLTLDLEHSSCCPSWSSSSASRSNTRTV